MESGGQPGNQNAAKGKRWSNAIDTALGNRCKSDGQKALVALAEKMLAAAELGEAWALKELGDRIDGKAHQSTSNETTLSISQPTTILLGDLNDDSDS